MNTKTLMGGLIGAIVFFFAGWLIFGIVLMGMTEPYTNMSCMRPPAEMSLLWIGVSNLFWGIAYAYIFSKMPSVTGFSSGVVQGVIIAVLIGLSFDLFMYATSTMNTSLVVTAYNAVGNAVLGAVGGGVIGWWLGRK